MSRASMLDRLGGRPECDVLVVGGGINGLSVFRELALQGVDVVLAEKDDFCSGASAALSRMVHGGLRYLENGEFRLVRESLRERDRLIANAPHLVRPLPTTVPIFDLVSGIGNGVSRFLGLSRRPGRRGAVVVKAGLTFYDLFTARRRMLPRHGFRNRAAALAAFPALNPAVRFAATYHDAWVSLPERLGLELLTDTLAVAPGAVALNHAAVRREGDGFVIADAVGGGRFPVRPRLVVNAAGGWIDDANRALGVAAPRLIGGTKGSHLVLDHPELMRALGGHMIFYENEDGRICIVFPYLGKVLVGSTDIRVDGAEGVRCEPEEVGYILQSLAFVFPGIAVGEEHVVFRFSGVRPLPASEDSVTGRIPRDHFCRWIEGAPPVLAMVGGKWTTFRSFGALAADEALGRLGAGRRVSTEDLAIGGGRAYPADPAAWMAAVAARCRLPEERVATLFQRYGTAASAFAAAEAAEPGPTLPGTDFTAAELGRVVRAEFVETLADLALRRTSLAVTGAVTAELIDRLAEILAAAKGWSAERTAQERRRFLALLAERHGLDPARLSPSDPSRSPACAPQPKFA